MIYDDLRVLDASHDLAGAYCSKLLTDLGADVVAVDDLPVDRRELYTYLRTSQTVGAGAVGVDRAGFDVVLGGLEVLGDAGPGPLVRVGDLRARRWRTRLGCSTCRSRCCRRASGCLADARPHDRAAAHGRR